MSDPTWGTAPRIAVVNGKGGSGKTTTAVALAYWWARNRGEVCLVDVDPQDVGSATWWLNRTDDEQEGLFWAQATARQLAAGLESIEATVIVDSPPALETDTVATVAALADLVIVPGQLTEVASIVQTAKTVAATSSAPVVCVITRALTASLDGSAGVESIAALEAIGVPVVGTIRQNMRLGMAALDGRRPDQLRSRDRRRARADIDRVAKAIVAELEKGQANA